jgi:RimK family alpha-L-glutamate ligase
MLIAVLGSTESWYVKDLRRAAGERHEIVPVPFRGLSATVDRGKIRVAAGGFDLHRADAVLVRTMPAGSLEQVVFRMDALAGLEAAGVPVINPPRAIETAVDKYLTSARLAAAGIPTPRTIVCQTADDAVTAIEALGTEVVLKPLFGSEGRGITRFADPALLERAAQLLVPLGGVLYVQEFLPHAGFDLRALVIGSRVIGMRRVSAGDWRTNVSQGAKAEPCELSAAERELALRAAQAVGAPLAGVDLLPARDGTTYVLEVNAVPGWQALSRACGVDVAKLVLEFLEQRSRSQSGQA